VIISAVCGSTVESYDSGRKCYGAFVGFLLKMQ